MKIEEIIYRNFMVLSRKHNADTPNKLKVVLKCSKQHASALLNKVSPLGKLTIKKLSAAWGIAPDEFYKEDIKQTPAQEIPWSLQTIIDSIRDDVKAINSRMDAQGNALQGLQDDCLEVKNEIHEIYKRMYEAAESKDVRKLKKVG